MGKNPPPSLLKWLLTRFTSSRAVGRRASGHHWQLARGHPLFLATLASSSLLHSEMAHEVSQRECDYFVNKSYNTRRTSSHFCRILLVRSISLGSAHTQREETYTKAWPPGAGDHWRHLRDHLLQVSLTEITVSTPASRNESTTTPLSHHSRNKKKRWCVLYLLSWCRIKTIRLLELKEKNN